MYLEDVLIKLEKQRKRKTESVWIATLSDNKELLNIHNIGYKNRPDGCTYDEDKIFDLLQQDSSNKLVFIHNHPAGDKYCFPSSLDIESTKDLIKRCKKNKVELLEHIIFTKTKHCSVLEYMNNHKRTIVITKIA